MFIEELAKGQMYYLVKIELHFHPKRFAIVDNTFS